LEIFNTIFIPVYSGAVGEKYQSSSEIRIWVILSAKLSPFGRRLYYSPHISNCGGTSPIKKISY
jgi:hypothetical protein